MSDPCRKVFTDTLLQKAYTDGNIVVVTTDARGSVTLNRCADELPNQFIEVGIAEQNAIGVAAGLAASGKKVFVCGPACFYSAQIAVYSANYSASAQDGAFFEPLFTMAPLRLSLVRRFPINY